MDFEGETVNVIAPAGDSDPLRHELCGLLNARVEDHLHEQDDVEGGSVVSCADPKKDGHDVSVWSQSAGLPAK